MTDKENAVRINTQPLVDLLVALRDEDESAALAIIGKVDPRTDGEIFASLMRTAIFHFSKNPLFYRRLKNIWTRNGRPDLKKTNTKISVQLVSDVTIDGLAEPLELFFAAFGISAAVAVSGYDSVSFEAFAADRKAVDLTVVHLSDQWLRRYMPVQPATDVQVAEAQTELTELANSIKARRMGSVAFTSFYPGAWPGVGSVLHAKNRVSSRRVISLLNGTLDELANDGILIIDTEQAIHIAGGATSVGHIAAMRMRSSFEETGLVGLARETASSMAHVFGRSHRALLTDWDNTLWGGEVGELGFAAIDVGPETPDGLGYQMLQSYMRDLTSTGVLLAAVSRNDPSMAEVLEENIHLPLKRAAYSVLELSWGDKSASVAKVSEQLNFGTDLMVYIDDNHVDLAEVVSVFPQIDVVLAGPEPDQSLRRLSFGRYFNTARLTDADFARPAQVSALQMQRSQLQASGSKADFIASLEIDVTVSDLNDKNRERVAQLLQKTNQFNLTTKRHMDDDLTRLRANGAKFGVFNYADRFGPQGIIGLMILTPADSGLEIDTWLMSCRVLNREVERSMLDWARNIAGQSNLVGSFIPTEKNGLVSKLYPSMGFEEYESGRYMLRPRTENPS
ncbi:HAD-IIIC family phosphatase [Mesorhizobium sp. SB112]|uniref:HAD-IIIC family phosphatase n=1 Tax=Mesorhizobium sp. SB112 TaxID=3151853 RepID=UPI00326750FA